MTKKILGLLIVFFAGYCFATAIYYTAPVVVEISDHITTPAEIQQQLVDAGEDIKVDGKICKGWNDPNHSETLKAWDRAICNEEASKHDYMYKETK